MVLWELIQESERHLNGGREGGGQQQDMSTWRPTRKEVLGLLVAESTESPSPGATAPRRKGSAGRASPQRGPTSFSHGKHLPKVPYCSSICETVQRWRRKAMLPVTALLLPGPQAFL